MHRDSKERRRRVAEISEKMTRQSRTGKVRKNNELRKRMQTWKNILLHGVPELRYMPREAQEQKIEL